MAQIEEIKVEPDWHQEPVSTPSYGWPNDDEGDVAVKQGITAMSLPKVEEGESSGAEKHVQGVMAEEAYSQEYDFNGSYVNDSRHPSLSKSIEAVPCNLDDNLEEKGFNQSRNEGPFPCPKCGREFKYRSNLNAHVLVHSTERPHTCDTCGKAFSQRRLLKSHLAIHSTERSFVCSICNKAFTQQRILKSHQQVHTGDKPYPCTTCGRAFAHRRVLKNHMLVHTGERRFKCDVCNKAFLRHADLMSHRVLHTKQGHLCTLCDKIFTRRGHLRLHLKRVHRGVETSSSKSVCG